MTKNEALKAAIDGKRVICAAWPNTIIRWDGEKFADELYKQVYPHKSDDSRWHNHWQIVPEYVDFAEAWKAYESGKEVKSASSCWHKKYEDEDSAICLSDIRGKWLILEDE